MKIIIQSKKRSYQFLQRHVWSWELFIFINRNPIDSFFHNTFRLINELINSYNYIIYLGTPMLKKIALVACLAASVFAE
jgi:hypothetical protein